MEEKIECLNYCESCDWKGCIGYFGKTIDCPNKAFDLSPLATKIATTVKVTGGPTI